MQTLELETMRCELEGHLGRLRLNRPQALNSEYRKELIHSDN